jgi:hypothetical protein
VKLPAAAMAALFACGIDTHNASSRAFLASALAFCGVGKLEFTVFDVGQGDSLFVVSPGGEFC